MLEAREGPAFDLCLVFPRSEKEALETTLFDLQQQLAQLETQKEKLEVDGKAWLLARDSLQGTTLGASPSPWS